MKRILFFGSLAAVTISIWYKFFKEMRKCSELERKHLLFLKRHNCIVLYSAGVITGWPPDPQELSESYKGFNLTSQYEPILYFLRTANQSLDVAVMLLHVKCIVDELKTACERNVKVRVIVDYERNTNNELLKTLSAAGASVLYYVIPEPNLCSILHYKYVVKDYEPESGYLCIGSMNWSSSSVVSNYEDLCFMSHPKTVSEFHENFQTSWDTIHEINTVNSHVKDILARTYNDY